MGAALGPLLHVAGDVAYAPGVGRVEAVEAQAAAMLDGAHPRRRSIGAIVEDADDRARLLADVRAFPVDPDASPPLRQNAAGDRAIVALERTLGAQPAAMRCFCRGHDAGTARQSVDHV